MKLRIACMYGEGQLGKAEVKIRGQVGKAEVSLYV